MTLRTFQIYRYDPDKDAKPYMQTIQVELDGNERMLLDALMKLKAVDPAFRSAALAAKACVVRTR
jgi:succinate dehydrogenase / fumarate reductase iron-sulfur subunit